MPAVATWMKALPASMTVEAKTVSPTPFSAGVDSPVRACWSIMAIPSTMSPSTGTTSPVLTTTMSPCRTFSSGVSISTPSTTEIDEARLLAEDVQQPLLGVVLRLLEELAPGAQAPGEHGAGEDLAGRQADEDDDRVEHVDAEPSLLEEGLVGALEARDHRVEEEHARQRQEGRRHELAGRGQAERTRADREVQVRAVPALRTLGLDQRLVQDLDQLVALDLLGVVHDEDGRGLGVGLVPVDAEGLDERPIDGVAHVLPAVNQAVPEANATGQLVLDLPGREHRPVPLDAPALGGVGEGDRQVARGVDVRRADGRARAVRAVPQMPGDLLDDLATRHDAVGVLDVRPGPGGHDLDGADLLDLEDAPDELLAGVCLGVGEEVAAGEPHAPVGGVGHRDVDAGGEATASVTHWTTRSSICTSPAAGPAGSGRRVRGIRGSW